MTVASEAQHDQAIQQHGGGPRPYASNLAAPRTPDASCCFEMLPRSTNACVPDEHLLRRRIVSRRVEGLDLSSARQRLNRDDSQRTIRDSVDPSHAVAHSHLVVSSVDVGAVMTKASCWTSFRNDDTRVIASLQVHSVLHPPPCARLCLLIDRIAWTARFSLPGAHETAPKSSKLV